MLKSYSKTLLGYNIGPQGIDGKFGSATTAAVMKYQLGKGLKVDGQSWSSDIECNF